MSRYPVLLSGAILLCAALLAGCAKGTPPPGDVPAFCAHGASYYDKTYAWDLQFYASTSAKRHALYVPIKYTCRLCAEVYDGQEVLETDAHALSADGSQCAVCGMYL